MKELLRDNAIYLGIFLLPGGSIYLGIILLMRAVLNKKGISKFRKEKI